MRGVGTALFLVVAGYVWVAIATPGNILAVNRWWQRKLRRAIPHRIYSTPGDRWAREWNQDTPANRMKVRVGGLALLIVLLLWTYSLLSVR